MANSFIINDVDVISISSMGQRQIFGELQFFVTLSIMDMDGNEIGITLASDTIDVLQPLTQEACDGKHCAN